MCSTCNYKQYDSVSIESNGRTEFKLQQKLGIAEKLIIQCDINGENYKMLVDGCPKSEFILYRCPTCGHKLY